MASLRDAAIALTGICTAVPKAGDGICVRCHGCPNPGFATCWSCATVERQVSRPCDLVVPVSLYEIPSQLHHVLRHYKSGNYPTMEADFTRRVAALLGYFVVTHGDHIRSAAGRDWDVITTVPSSTGRTGQHPLVTAIGLLPTLRDQHEPLLRKGPVDVAHLNADDRGYVAKRPLTGRSVLLVDDTFTSSARAQSAASALAIAGAHVLAILPVGRVINPGYSDAAAEYWKRQRRAPFSWDTCCVEST